MVERTILLKGRGIRKEGTVGASVITPGYLVERGTTGVIDPHGTASEPTLKAFAVENELIGQEITVDYAVGDNVVYEVMPPGAEVHALLAASAAAIVIGDLLESAGDGTLRLIVPEVGLTDATGGTGSDQLEDVTGTPTQTLINNNLASIADKINALLPAGVLSGAIARALEAVDNSGGGSEARINVEIV